VRLAHVETDIQLSTNYPAVTCVTFPVQLLKLLS